MNPTNSTNSMNSTCLQFLWTLQTLWTQWTFRRWRAIFPLFEWRIHGNFYLWLVRCPDKPNLAGEVSHNVTVNSAQRRSGGVYPRLSVWHSGIWALFGIWILSFGLGLSFGLWYLSFICHFPLSVTPPVCTAHKHKGQMLTKRIERTLTIESAAGSRLMYLKELFVFGKKIAAFTKRIRIIPAPLTLSPYDPNNNVFFIYAHFEA